MRFDHNSYNNYKASLKKYYTLRDSKKKVNK